MAWSRPDSWRLDCLDQDDQDACTNADGLTFQGTLTVSEHIAMADLFTNFVKGLDPHRDTPVELLHTVLLGVVKYIWHGLCTSLTEEQRTLFATRLQGTNISGLSIPNIRASYMMQYRNALIGKHFKTLMQTTVFHVHDLVNENQFRLIKAMGKFGAVLWYHEIESLDAYLVCRVQCFLLY
jgi:hypothetical protein